MHESNLRFKRKLVGNLTTKLEKKMAERRKKKKKPNPELLNVKVKSDWSMLLICISSSHERL